MVCLNWLLAARTIHKSKRDTQRRPLVLEELNNAIGVENMTTPQLSARLFT